MRASIDARDNLHVRRESFSRNVYACMSAIGKRRFRKQQYAIEFALDVMRTADAHHERRDRRAHPAIRSRPLNGVFCVRAASPAAGEGGEYPRHARLIAAARSACCRAARHEPMPALITNQPTSRV
ncbi:hypothetical protein [Lysobacter gummosus]|uniref:hypothetical protein n=1 Tax=Lysobacter gummosus TaxID=262324 RepID=UPI00363AAC91